MATLLSYGPQAWNFCTKLNTATNGPGFMLSLLHRTNKLPQKLAIKLDTKLFSHFVKLLEILQTLCVSLWVKTQTVQSFFCENKVNSPQPGAPARDWLCMQAELPAGPGPPRPAECPNIKATSSSLRDFLPCSHSLHFSLNYFLTFSSKLSAEKFLTGSTYTGWEHWGEICPTANDIYCFSLHYKVHV